MTDHFLIDHFDGHGCAVLERMDSSTITVPIEWLPEDAQVGHALRLTLSPGTKRATVEFELDEGNTEPSGVNVGG